jgi:hypothetical protein
LLTVRGVNFQFHGETWLVAYSPANAEADHLLWGAGFPTQHRITASVEPYYPDDAGRPIVVLT